MSQKNFKNDPELKKLKVSPALTLFVLAPAVGELLSGSSPPMEFFNPVVFLFLASLYGSGAIVMRELKVRWKKDFRSLLLLGAAYGILEEGLMVKSFFDPNWMDLGILGSFGRWLEVNWVWAEMLTIFHAVFSITIPITLVELAYSKRKSESWVGKKLLACLLVVLALLTLVGAYFGLTPYTYYPPAPQYMSAIVIMSLFVYAAYRLSPRRLDKHTASMPSARKLFFLSCAGSTAFFLLFFVGPHVINSPIIIMLLGVILVLGAAKYLARFEWENPTDRLAVVAGGLSFLVFLAFLQEPNPSARGMSLVGLATVFGLLLMKRKIKANN